VSESEDDDPKLAAFLREPPSSGSQFKASMEDSSDTDTEDEAEPENNKPDTSKKAKARKKQNLGLIAREQITTAVAALPDQPHASKKAPVKRVSTQCSG
jgi:hypothetical protein